MKKENIHDEIANAVKSLLKLARESSLNEISDNCLFVISEIKNSGDNFFDLYKIRRIENERKQPKTLEETVRELNVLYSNLYDVNLSVYKAKRSLTIIEIQYFQRSSLEFDLQKEASLKETMLGVKVTIPPYVTETKEKFDINWQLDTFNFKWKMFWWNRKMKKLLK